MAADPKIKVEAELELKKAREAKRRAKDVAKEIESINDALQKVGGAAAQSLGRIGSTMSRIGGSMRRSSASSNNLVRNLVAMGATYIGVRAVSSAVSSLASQFIEVNSTVQNMSVSLSALLSNVEGISFDQAREEASGLFRQLNDIAVQSPATATDLMQIFSGIYGPMRNAGTSMQDLLTLTRDSASVAATLGVEYQDVGRHISKMVAGNASNEEATFRMLRSMGLITQTTEEWNRAALEDPTQAANRLLEIFQQLGGPASEEFGRTWTGVSSTFRGLLQQFARIFSGPSFRVVIDQMRRVNDFLLRYRGAIEVILESAGTRIAEMLDATVNRIAETFQYVITNLNTIAARIDGIITAFHSLAPIIRRMAIVGVALKIGALALGTALTVGGAVLGALSSVLGVLMSVVGAVVPMLGALAGGGGIAGLLGIGGAGAAAAAGGTVATGGLGPLIAIGAVLTVALPLLLVLVGVIAGIVAGFVALAGAVMAVIRHADFFGDWLADTGPMFWEIVTNFWRALVHLYNALAPTLETVGMLIAGVVVGSFRLLMVSILFLSRHTRSLALFFSLMMATIRPQIRAIETEFRNLVIGMRIFGYWLRSVIPGAGASPVASGTQSSTSAQGLAGNLREQFQIAMIRAQKAIEGQSSGEGTGRAPGARPTTNVDMRGSRIEVRQEFREADPDRVWIQMRDALEREAVQRTTSGFVPALTR